MNDSDLAPAAHRRTTVISLSTILAAAWLMPGCSNVADYPALAPSSSMVLLDGTTLLADQLKGKVTLVNFWATSCTTCVAEMPHIAQTYKKFHAQGYDTIAVAMSYDPPAYVLNFAQTRALPFKVAIDNTGAVAKAWGDVKLTPTSYLVNKKGQIVKRYVGAPDFAALDRLIEQLLTQKA